MMRGGANCIALYRSVQECSDKGQLWKEGCVLLPSAVTCGSQVFGQSKEFAAQCFVYLFLIPVSKPGTIFQKGCVHLMNGEGGVLYFG